MPPELNPGSPAGGSPKQIGRQYNFFSRVSNPGFDVDTKGLDTLSQKIGLIVSDVGKLDKAIEKLTTRMDGLAKSTDQAFGGGQQGIGTKGNSAAPVSAFKTGTAALAFGALGEAGAQVGGSINTLMGSVVSGATGTDIIARQTNSIFGPASASARNTVAGFNTMSNMSPQDLQQALATMQANPRLYAGNGTAKQKALTSFVNQLQKMNPGMSAAQAMQTANALASGPVLSSMQRYGALTQALPNYKTGGINSTNTVFSGLMKTLEGGRNLTPAQLKAMSGNSNYATQQWSLITQNNSSPMGMGLSNTMLTDLRAWAAGGGSASALEKSMGKSPAAHQLANATSATRRNDTLFEHSTGAQNAVSDAERYLNNFATAMGRDVPGLAAAGVALGAATKGLTKVLELVGVGGVFYEGIKGLKSVIRKVTGQTTPSGSTTNGGGSVGTGGGYLGSVSIEGCVEICGCKEGGTPNKTSRRKTRVKKKSSGGGGGFWSSLEPSNWLSDAKDTVRDFGGVAYGAYKILNKGPKGDFPDIPPEVGDPPTGSTTTRGMQPSLAKRVNAMRAANPNLRISSGHRTSAQQATLYAMKGGRGVARPGQSKHQSGKAADLGPPSQFGWIAKNASKFGLARPAPRSEPWHVETMGDPVVGGATMAATGANVVSDAQSFLGTPYVWGGTSSGGVDCSGLVYLVYKSVGINLPRTSQQQAKAGKAVSGLGAAMPGDLILYNEPGEGPNSHVAIYIGGGKQIAAPHTGTVVQIQGIDKAHLSCIRRIIGGGGGGGAASTVVQAAQSMVGTPSNDAANHATGVNVGLTNTFIGMVNAGGAGLTGSGPTTAASAGGGGTTSASGVSASGSSVSGTVSWSGTDKSISSPTQFSAALMRKLGLSSMAQDVMDVNAWQQHEGQWGAKGNYNAMIMHNPLNARLNSMAGAVPMTGTTAYPSWSEGVAATAQMIQQSNMKPILTALKANANLASFTKALESTPWAQSAYGGQSFSAPSGMYAMGDPESMPTMSSGGGGGAASISAMTKGRGGIYIGTLNIPITLAGTATQQDAQNIAQMVMQEIQKQSGLSSVSGS